MIKKKDAAVHRKKVAWREKKVFWGAVFAALLVIIAAFLYLGLRRGVIPRQVGEFNLPVMPPADFNRLVEVAHGKGFMEWSDKNSDSTFILPDGSIDLAELQGKGVKKQTVKKGGKYYFGKAFLSEYAAMVESLREERVKKELGLTIVKPIETDLIARLKKFQDVTDDEIALYRNGVQKLLEAAPILRLMYQKQLGAGPDDRIKAKTDDDRELIDRYGHPWCLSDTSVFCVGSPSLKKRTSGVIPLGLPCDVASTVGGPFEVVAYDELGKLVPIPYAEEWFNDLVKAAVVLREAATIFSNIPREAKFAAYLKGVASAFESKWPYPYSESDPLWNDALSSESLLFARIGADEVGGDGVGDLCESKARFHFNIGIVNKDVHEVIERLKSSIQRFEDQLSLLIGKPNDYAATEVKVQLPIFLDVIYANGDDVGGPNGTPIGQTLPNWCGKDGKGECLRSAMIYVNKLLEAYSDELMRQYIMPLFEPSFKEYFNAKAGIDSAVYHEIFHNIGPMDKKVRPGSDVTYGERQTTKEGESWKLPMEELKAQTGSMYMAGEFYNDAVKKHQAGDLSDAEFEKEVRKYREHIVYDIAWALRMILKASRSGPEFQSRSPYSRLSAVQVGFLTEKGALIYNTEAKWWSIDFNRMPDAVTELLKKTGQLYAAANVDEIEKFFLYYMKGNGEKLLHRDRLVEAAGKMPSTLFDYRLKGL